MMNVKATLNYKNQFMVMIIVGLDKLQLQLFIVLQKSFVNYGCKERDKGRKLVHYYNRIVVILIGIWIVICTQLLAEEFVFSFAGR